MMNNLNFELKKVRFISNLEVSDRESVFEKNYMKIFALSIILLILGIIITSIGKIYAVYAEYESQQEYTDMLRTTVLISTFAVLTLQLGMVLFSLSTFIGAVADKELSRKVRRGMVHASSMAIIGLVLIVIFSSLFVGLF